VEVLDVFVFTADTWRELRDQHCVPDDDPAGRAGWRLAHPRRLRELIPLRGLPGLFPLEPALAAQVERSQLNEKGRDR